MSLRLLPLTLALSSAFASAAQAQSLTQLFEAAKAYDAGFKSAQAQYQANLSRAEQSRAALRPTAALSSSMSESDVDNQTSPRASGQSAPRVVSLSASYPLYRPANQANAAKAEPLMALAAEQLRLAEQDLMVRTAQAYVDVLNAQEALTFVQAQKTAVSEQLAAAKRNFEVGTATITDTREAQARFDLVLAQEIAADNDLRVKRLALDQLTGVQNAKPLPLAPEAAVQIAGANSVDAWVQQGLQSHPSIRVSQHNLALARLDQQAANAALRPTVDASASYAMTRYGNRLSTNFSTNVATVGVSLNLPLYTGGANENRIKETLALQDKASQDQEAAQRTVSQATRTAFFGVQSGLGQIKALEAAERSSQSALDANKLGYQVGVRINIDVLNSQSQLFQTKRDLAKARYDVLVGQLRLRQAAGVLQLTDLQALDGLLKR
ncbi:MAG: outer membrane protein TolC precursor [Pseudomonadota bacterium]|jgi:outer membrane protein